VTSGTVGPLAQAERLSVDDFQHGYPPPEQPPGTTVVAYCGVLMVVQGEFDPAPPSEACPRCVKEWRRRSR
jgi:hypothetical protein